MFGGAAGLAIGSVTHGHGWLAVIALVAVAGFSGVLSSPGDIGSATGLQLLGYTALGAGPAGARLAAALNASHLMAEAATALGLAGTQPPPLVIDTVGRLGGAIANGTPPPLIPPPWDTSPIRRPSGRCSASSAAGSGSVLTGDGGTGGQRFGRQRFGRQRFGRQRLRGADPRAD